MESKGLHGKFPIIEQTEENLQGKYWEREEMMFPAMDPRCPCLQDFGEILPNFEEFCDMNKKRIK